MLFRSPHLFYPEQKEISASGSILTSYDCAHLRFLRFAPGGQITDVEQQNQCVAGLFQYSLVSSNINQVELIHDGHGPMIELRGPAKDTLQSDLVAGKTKFLVFSHDAETIVSRVVLIHDNTEVHMESRGDGLFALNYFLEEGLQSVDLLAQDIAGNQSRVAMNLNVVGPFAFRACDVYPNPIRTTGTVDCRFSQLPEKLQVSLYDVSGSRVKNLNVMPTRHMSEFLDLENDRGFPLRNGVYFLKVQAFRGAERIHKILKIAITR